MKEIQLTRGKVTLVDDDNYDELMQFRWYAYHCLINGAWYAQRSIGSRLHSQLEHMHRRIMKAPLDFEVDHRNLDTLDNRKENLRLATRQQNAANRRRQINNTSGFKGVSLFRRDNNFKAQIKVDGHKMHIGYFDTPEAAAHAYDAAALRYFGEFAWLNFPVT